MGKGKARRRRQANYEASHSSRLALAPPPTKKDVNAVPSKLRQIMKFMSTGTDENARTGPSRKAPAADDQSRKFLASEKKKEGGPVFKPEAEQQEPSNDSEKTLETSESKLKKKRKRSDNSEFLGEQPKAKKGMRERRKSYLKEKKEKKKNKKQKLREDDDDGGLKQLYQQEAVPFGEVVEAPPKLPMLRKAPNKDGKKPGLSLSDERIRLQAVEAYRKKRGWESRPGLKIPV